MNLEHILTSIGYVGIFAIIFAESGLLIGFFLPGDSLLFTAGFLASRGFFNIQILLVIIFLAACLGDSVGYGFGRRVGRKLFNKTDSVFFHKENLLKAEEFYEKHGKLTIILARFLPVVRTFAPIVAGMGKMEYRVFLAYNLVGGLVWGVGLTALGYFLGSKISDIDKYLLPIVLFILFISIAPSAYHLLKDENNRRQILNYFKQLFKNKN